MKSAVLLFTVFMGVLSAATGCSRPLDWPASPLFTPPADTGGQQQPDKQSALRQIIGHYAHYDVVAYEETNTQTPMKTMVITYGFTDFYMKDGKLYQEDRFCHAEQKLNQPMVKPVFSDAAVQAILPRVQEVEVSFRDGQWHLYRPASPTLLGIQGDPLLPLSRDKNDPALNDPDGDGKPGVTVQLNIGAFIKGYIYITRREIYQDHLVLHSNGNLYGYVEDSSEQFVVGASMKVLRQQSNPHQHPDFGLSPMILVRISNDIDTCAELMAQRDSLFPPEPEFR